MNIAEVNTYLQSELARRQVNCVPAVEAARWLHEARILRDSPSRAGKPLRDLLRAGQIVGQRQELNSRWFICRNSEVESSKVSAVDGPRPEPAGHRFELGDAELFAARLRDHAFRVGASSWPGNLRDLHLPGLDSWWVDGPGAAQLSKGLGLDLPEGLVYAGQAGAANSAFIVAVKDRPEPPPR